MTAPETPARKGFWSTLPGILTAIGGVIAGIAALLQAFHSVGLISPAQPTAVLPTPASFVALATVPPGAAPATQPTPSGLLFADDFADPQSGWYLEVSPDSERSYQTGELRISVFKPNWDAWSYSGHFDDLADLSIEVDARRVEGPARCDYGILVRMQDDATSFYTFAITSDGTYSVQISRGDEWIKLVDWTASDAIRQGALVNHLRVECEGAHLAFLANNRLLTELDDKTCAQGDVGLIAGTFDDAGAVVAFDNLRVWKLR